MDKAPFSVYDFFGYLASGFTLLASFDWAFGNRWILDSSLPPPGLTVLLVITIYVAGHVVAHLSSIALEVNLLRKVLGPPEQHLLATSLPKSRWRLLFPENFTPLPVGTRNRILAKGAAAGLDGDPSALFLHCYAIVKQDQSTLERLNTFLNLYGFCRNLSMALVLCSCVFFFSFIVTFSWPLSSDTKLTIALIIASLFSAYALLLRYMKFFRHYTHEVFVTYAESTTA